MFVPDFEPNDAAKAEEDHFVASVVVVFVLVAVLVAVDLALVTWAGW